jgi:hypothetical protein
MAPPDATPGEEMPKGIPSGKLIRGALQVAGGFVPLAGGVLSAAAGACRRVNRSVSTGS